MRHSCLPESLFLSFVSETANQMKLRFNWLPSIPLSQKHKILLFIQMEEQKLPYPVFFRMTRLLLLLLLVLLTKSFCHPHRLSPLDSFEGRLHTSYTLSLTCQSNYLVDGGRSRQRREFQIQDTEEK